MASWQAHVSSWLLRLRFKPRLARVHDDIRELRALMTPPVFPVPRGVAVACAQVGGVTGEWVDQSRGKGPTLLYLHGGAYCACSAETHRAVTVGFAEQGFRVFVPNYRLAPEHPFPAALDDAVAVRRNLPEHLVVAGDSSGGGLALALMLACRDRGLPLPAAAALFCPWTDLAATGDSIRTNARRCAMLVGEQVAPGGRLYLGDADARNPLASPLYADLSHLSPLMIHVGADEVLLDDSRRLAERARAAGVATELKIWPVVPHAWQLFYRRVPEAGQSIREASVFLKTAGAESLCPKPSMS